MPACPELAAAAPLKAEATACTWAVTAAGCGSLVAETPVIAFVPVNVPVALLGCPTCDDGNPFDTVRIPPPRMAYCGGIVPPVHPASKLAPSSAAAVRAVI
jgi:hypothetical protein